QSPPRCRAKDDSRTAVLAERSWLPVTAGSPVTRLLPPKAPPQAVQRCSKLGSFIGSVAPLHRRARYRRAALGAQAQSPAPAHPRRGCRCGRRRKDQASTPRTDPIPGTRSAGRRSRPETCVSAPGNADDGNASKVAKPPVMALPALKLHPRRHVGLVAAE